MPVLEDGDHRIGYADTGPVAEPGAATPVLFAHCSLGHSGLWKAVTRALAPRWRCIAFDLPGHGASDRGDRAISLQDQAVRDAALLAERFGGGRAHLVGLSLGGAIMGRAAARRSGLALSVVMIEPIMMHLLKDSPQDMTADNDGIMGPVIAACRTGRYADGARAFMEGWGQPGQFDAMSGQAQAAVAAAMRWVFEDFGMAHSWVDGQLTRAEIAAIAAPVRLMQGETTQPSAKAVVDAVAGLIDGAAVTEIAGAGHLSPVERPDVVAQEIAAFLTEVETAEAA